jgi:hypothetical protein
VYPIDDLSRPLGCRAELDDPFWRATQAAGFFFFKPLLRQVREQIVRFFAVTRAVAATKISRSTSVILPNSDTEYLSRCRLGFNPSLAQKADFLRETENLGNLLDSTLHTTYTVQLLATQF